MKFFSLAIAVWFSFSAGWAQTTVQYHAYVFLDEIGNYKTQYMNLLSKNDIEFCSVDVPREFVKRGGWEHLDPSVIHALCIKDIGTYDALMDVWGVEIAYKNSTLYKYRYDLDEGRSTFLSFLDKNYFKSCECISRETI